MNWKAILKRLQGAQLLDQECNGIHKINAVRNIFSQERGNYYSKMMTGLYQDDGSIARDHMKILKEQSKFYKKLFKADKLIQVE